MRFSTSTSTAAAALTLALTTTTTTVLSAPLKLDISSLLDKQLIARDDLAKPHNRLTFHFNKQSAKHKQWPRTLTRRNILKKRQGVPSTNTTVDDESELYNFEDTRYIATINLAGQDMDVILDTGSTDTFVYSAQPTPFIGLDPSTLPPLFDNATAVGLYDTGLTYSASYGGGNGVTETLGAIQLANAELNGTDFIAQNMTFANLYQSTSATGASGLLGLGFPINGEIWLEMLELEYNLTGRWLTPNESSAYYPLVPLLYAQGDIQNQMFSLEVSRLGPEAIAADNADPLDFNYTENGGILTLGDYPESMGESDFAWSDVPIVRFTEAGQARWTLPLEAIYFNGRQITNTTQQRSLDDDDGIFYALIDSGNPSVSIPSDMMEQITNAYAGNRAGYTVPCDSPFELIFQFAGRNFTQNATDFLVPSRSALDTLGFGGFAFTDCQVQMQPGDVYPDELGPRTSITYQLGDPFLRNVITVFDYGSLTDAEMDGPRLGLAPKLH